MTCDDCPSSVRSTSLTLDPRESSVASPEAFRNGRMASVTLGAATTCFCAGVCEGARPGSRRPLRTHPPASRPKTTAAASAPMISAERDPAGVVSVLVLTVTGRRTGTPFTVPVVYFPHEGDYLVMGSAGGMKDDPQWVRNLKAAGQAHIQVGTEIYVAHGRVTDGTERDELWQTVVLARAPFAAKYAEKSGRRIPIARLTPSAR